MKLDPDEHLSDNLKESILDVILKDDTNAISFDRRLWFMERPLPFRQELVRVWRRGLCRFSDVSVNEHPIIAGDVTKAHGDLEHYDSPDLDHWLEKQNRYTTLEAIIRYKNSSLSDTPKIFGTSLQRRMWLKYNSNQVPFRYFLLFIYYWLYKGLWKAGMPGYLWSKLRSDVMRLIEYKHIEMKITGRIPQKKVYGKGVKNTKVRQYE